MSSRTHALLPGLLALLTVGACGEVHGATDASASPDAPVLNADAAPLDAARSCRVLPMPGASNLELILVAAVDNPPGCAAATPCEVWFGHGQHLRCPRWDAPESGLTAACDLGVYDEATGSYDPCLCDEGAGFVADFATGEVLDARGPVPCRYGIEAD